MQSYCFQSADRFPTLHSTYNKAAMHTNSEAEASKHEGDLIGAASQHAGPQPEPSRQAITNGEPKWDMQAVCHGKSGVLGQVGDNDLPYRVRIDKADIEYKGYEVILEDGWL